MTDVPEEADFILFNTCAVRQHAEDRVYGLVGKYVKLKKKIGIIGCIPQLYGRSLLQKFPFDLIAGTYHYEELPELIARACSGEQVVKLEFKNLRHLSGMHALRQFSFKAFVTIMRGCNNWCTYCVVPRTRGPEVSRPLEDIVEEVRQLVENGYKEITLLGQNVNSYGRDLYGKPIFDILLEKLNSLDGDFIIRFTTSLPNDLTIDVVKAMTLPKIAEHIHLPIQSGSDAVLKRMNRKYTVDEYFEKVELLRKYIPQISITTDIIVGFPGETIQDFENTLKVVEQIGFEDAFTFAFSPRPGTPAANFPDQVPVAERKRRLNVLNQLLKEVSRRISLKKYVGNTYRCLCEEVFEKKARFKTRTNRVVETSCLKKIKKGEWYDVKVIGVKVKTLLGKLNSLD